MNNSTLRNAVVHMVNTNSKDGVFSPFNKISVRYHPTYFNCDPLLGLQRNTTEPEAREALISDLVRGLERSLVHQAVSSIS